MDVWEVLDQAGVRSQLYNTRKSAAVQFMLPLESPLYARQISMIKEKRLTSTYGEVEDEFSIFVADKVVWQEIRSKHLTDQEAAIRLLSRAVVMEYEEYQLLWPEHTWTNAQADVIRWCREKSR